MNLFGTYPLHELPNLALKEEEFEQILSQSEKKDQNDLLLSPPTHSSQFFVKSLFLKNSKINQEKVDMKEKAKIKKEPKEKKILIYERVKKYMARNNLSPRECAILSNVPDIINSRNGVICLSVIKRVELYFSGKYLDHNYDQLFRRWLIYKRETDWKELRKKHFQKKEFDTHAVDYHFEDYTSEEIRSMIKKIIQKSKKTEYKLSQSKIAAIVNIDKFRFRNVKYTMQKYLTGKSSSKDHSLDRKFYDWLFLRGKLLPPLSKSLTFSDSNEKGDEKFTEKEQEHEQEQEQEQEQFRGKVGKNSKIQTKNNNNGYDRKHGHKHRHKHRNPKRNHNKLNSNDNLDDLVQNLRSHKRKIKNKSKKKSKSKKKKSKNLTRKKKKKFSKSHIPNEIDQNYTNKLIPTLRAGSFDFNSVQIKQRKRKPNYFEKKMLKKKIKNI